MEVTMKTSFTMLILLLIAALPLLGQAGAMTASFNPSTVQVNSFNTASFDPTSPESQPVLTTLTIQNNTSESYIFRMKLTVKWNESTLTTAEFRSKEAIPANGIFYPLTNRDLITTSASTHFDEIGVGGITLQDVIENSSVLRRAVLAGFFPDGTVRLEVQVRPDDTSSVYGNPAVFSIIVRNAGTISLVSPGVPLGEQAPIISTNPMSFFWNAINTEFNQYYLNILEFPPNVVPTVNNVEAMGQHFWPLNPTPVTGGVYSEYIPFVPGNYYAWQISTTLYTETNPYTRERDQSSLKSNWYVFRFAPQDQAPAITINELQAALSSLGNPAIEAIFSGGFAPIGVIQSDGQSMSGEEAINLIRSLVGRNVVIDIRN